MALLTFRRVIILESVDALSILFSTMLALIRAC
jgi:hypothetical protein